MYALVCGALLAIYSLERLYVVIKARNDYGSLPRLLTPIPPVSILGAILPRSPFHRGLIFFWDERSTTYEDANLKTIAVVPALYGQSALYTSSLPVLHQCLSLNAPFKKPENPIFNILGENILTTQGETWRRHRRITGPAFNHATYRNVWETTARVYDDILKQEGWQHIDETAPTNFNKITHKLALFLIAIVGFGIPMSWYEPPRDEHGRLSVQAMVFEVASTILARGQLPKWVYYLGLKKLNEIDEAYKTFETFMHERINEREAHLKKIRGMDGTNDADVAESIKDVFGRLVNARLSDGKLSLSDEEIIGNCFIFTFAGHETTANTLAAALALLATNPDKQEWVYNSIKAVVGDRTPTFEDFDALTGVLGCFYEALRMFPAAYMMIRLAAKDLTLSIPRRDNPAILEHVPVKKDTAIHLDVVGMFYDPQTFPEPEEFKPERWVSSGKLDGASSITKDTEAGEISTSSPASTLEGFFGFSLGPRTCLGHKFAKVESVAFLTYLLKDWRVVPALRGSETVEQWKERVIQPDLKVTLALDDVPVRLVRRK